ncbi:MAG: deoxyribodipyrimidine photo-lyase [Polyangia bacterium]
MDVLEQLRQSARVTVRRDGVPDPEGRCVLYWMQRAQRSIDNPALDVAIAAGNALGLPVVAFLGVIPSYPHGNVRHYAFLADGVPALAAGLARRNVGFVLRAHPDHSLRRIVEELRPALVVGDENPLRETEAWRVRAAEKLRLPLWTVDADVIVPTRLYGKEQFSARTIRPRLRARLAEFLVRPVDEPARVRFVPPPGLLALDPLKPFLGGLSLDRSVPPVPRRGGQEAALEALRRFVAERLDGYAAARGLPELAATSGLSPYLHFGHLGPRTLAIAIEDADAPAADKEAFLEQLIVRRELAINFVRYNPRYDRVEGCEPWARYTLNHHARDKRPRVLSLEQLERGESPDPLWNAAQREMVLSGWMHGYVRMYWAKKLLEWCPRVEDAYAVAVRFNDKYELDGRDPNGYAGIAWAIGGKHDRAWGPERPIFGKIRYMSLQSTSRKFDAKAYMARVGAMVRGS